MDEGRKTTQRYDTASTGVRNPFGTMDVPDPNDWDVVEFAATVHLDGGADDDNAVAWVYASGPHQSIDGEWSSRWNGGTDPTIAGDALDKSGWWASEPICISTGTAAANVA